MTLRPIERLRVRVTQLFREAIEYHEVMSLVDEDNPQHIVHVNEFRASLDIIDRLITADERFSDLRALRAVRDTLTRFHRSIDESLPMTQIRLEQLIEEIDGVEKAAADLQVV